MPTKNKEKQKEYAKKHYLANKEKVKETAHINNKKAILRNRLFIKDYLKDKCCVDCGNTNPIVLEFDHIIGVKRKNVSEMITQAYSLKTIKEEISKCEIRCANCHRIVTHYRRLEIPLTN